MIHSRFPATPSWRPAAPHRRLDGPARFAGVAMIAGAAAIGMLYRWLLQQGGDDLFAWHIVLGFPACLLAAFGVLLLINGARLRDEWHRRCFDAPPATVSADADPATLAATITDGRVALASLLALRAIDAAAAINRRADTAPDRRARSRPGRHRA